MRARWSEIERIIRRVAARRDGDTLSSSTPRPTSSGSSSGSPPASPQTSTGMPAACAGRHDARDQADHGRVVRDREAGDRRVLAVGGERVLDEVVRPDREEVASPRDRAGVEAPPRAPRSSRRRAGRARRARRRRARVERALADGVDVGRPRPPSAPGSAARVAGDAQQRAQLRVEPAGAREREPDAARAEQARRRPASARNGGVLSAPKSSVRTVAIRFGERARAAARARRRAPARSARRVASRNASSLRSRPMPSAPASSAAVDLRRGAGVGQQPQDAAVGGRRRPVALRVIGGGLDAQPLDPVLEPRPRGGVGPRARRARGRRRCRPARRPGSRARGSPAAVTSGTCERARDDRRVRGRAAAGEHDRGDPAGPGRDLAGAEVVARPRRRRPADRRPRRARGRRRGGRRRAGRRRARRASGRRASRARARAARPRAAIASARGRAGLRLADRRVDQRLVGRHQVVRLDDLGVGGVAVAPSAPRPGRPARRPRGGARR